MTRSELRSFLRLNTIVSVLSGLHTRPSKNGSRRAYLENESQPLDTFQSTPARLAKWPSPILQPESQLCRTWVIHNRQRNSCTCSPKDVRLIVGTRPRRAVVNVVVPGHMLCNHSNAVGSIFGQEICGGESRDSGSARRQSRQPVEMDMLEHRTPEPRYCAKPYCLQSALFRPVN